MPFTDLTDFKVSSCRQHCIWSHLILLICASSKPLIRLLNNSFIRRISNSEYMNEMSLSKTSEESSIKHKTSSLTDPGIIMCV